MESYTCSVQGCPESAVYLCKCQDPPLNFCEIHLLRHTKTGVRQSHVLFPISVEISEEEINIALKAISKVYEATTKAASLLTQQWREEIAEINKKYSDKLQALWDSIGPLLNRLEMAIATNMTLRSSEDELLLHLSEGADLEEEKQEYLLQSILSKENPSLFKQPTDLRPVFLKQERFNYCFMQKTKKLVEIDNKDLTKRVIEIGSLPENMGHGAGICQFEDGELFY